MLIVLLIIGLYGISYGLEIIAGVQLLYTVVLGFYRPYYIRTQNILLVICQSVGVLFTVFLAVIQYVEISDKIASFVVLGF